MNNLKLILLAGSAIACNHSFALDVNVQQPGSLSSLITDLNITTLNVSGKINAQDLFFIGDNLTSLTSLNLKDATIESYSGDNLHGQTEYAAGLIPASTFAASALNDISLPSTGDISIGDLAFAESKITSLQIPSNVTSIGTSAFSCCDGLTSLQVPDCSIGSYAFSGCSNITEITLPDNASVAEGAFLHCTKLATVTGSENLSTIGDYSFLGCSNLQQFAFGQDLKAIGVGAFDGAALSEVDLTLSKKLKSVGTRAFANNKSLIKVTFGSSDSPTLGEGSFIGCTSITDFSMPGVSEMPDYMLSDVKSLSNLVIPPTVSYIGDNAMTGMTALKSINVTSLTAVPELGTDVWHNVDQSAVTVSALEDIADEFQAADQWREFSYNVETGVADNLTAAKASVKGRFDGNVLQIIASGCDLKCVTLFDVAGATLTTAYVNADSASISTADFSSRIYIVNVSLSNGDSATLKLIRK